MFALTDTFTQETGFRITPIKMQDEGFVFLPKELESQLDYVELAKTICQSESFVENTEYVILRGSKLKHFKELLDRANSIGSVMKSYPHWKRSRSMAVLTESGLYTALILSRKPEAHLFRRWITCEVLPSIRQTGMYKTSQGTNSLDMFQLSVKIDMLHKTVINQHSIMRDLLKMLMTQKNFQQNAVEILQRIEARLSESLAPNMFDNWQKINNLIDEISDTYDLSLEDKQRYVEELCAMHNVHLPTTQASIKSQSDISGKKSDKAYKLSKRQKKALSYIEKNGKITNKEYRELFDVTDRTALRDLKQLVDIGLLQKQGHRRNSCYVTAK